ncbi:hypothetical protein WKW80_00585 [Variovorax humicola]|uniref:Beta-ketoacyl-[acyl-carrier-protein] synthase III N-terminal domain-containing protein n=1 Tax=Variovorax humicola TaxID=1769758 RepID=A0ABU8VRV6_9BURK
MQVSKNNILHGLAYALGEDALEYGSANGFEALKLPNRPALWGWGQYRRATSLVLDLQLAAARGALANAGLDPLEIDGVLFCHAISPVHERDATASACRFLVELGLDNAFPITLGFNGCAAMLSGVTTADGLLRSGRFRNLLVVAGDVHPEAEARFLRYAIFSDAACACVMSANSASGYELIGSAMAADNKTMSADATFSSELAMQTNQALLGMGQLQAPGVARVFCNNVFLPITMLKETEGGFEPDQIYTGNVNRIAHCYSADALINLCDYAAAGAVEPGDYFVAASDSPGLRASLLLRAI